MWPLFLHGRGENALPPVAGTDDSLTVGGTVSREFLETADSAKVTFMPFAAPFARNGGSTKQRDTFPIEEDGHFAFLSEFDLGNFVHAEGGNT